MQQPHLVQQRVVQVLISQSILLKLSANSQLVAPRSPCDYGVKCLDETLRTRGTSEWLHALMPPADACGQPGSEGLTLLIAHSTSKCPTRH